MFLIFLLAFLSFFYLFLLAFLFHFFSPFNVSVSSSSFLVPSDLCSLPPFFSIFLTSTRVEIQDGNWNDRMDIIPCFPSYFPYSFPGCRNLRNNRSEISRNIGREVYSSKLLEIVSTFLSRGFHSLKLGFLLSKEIFFTDPCFRGAVKKGKEKKMINSLPSFSRFPWHF